VIDERKPQGERQGVAWHPNKKEGNGGWGGGGGGGWGGGGVEKNGSALQFNCVPYPLNKKEKRKEVLVVREREGRSCRLEKKKKEGRIRCREEEITRSSTEGTSSSLSKKRNDSMALNRRKLGSFGEEKKKRSPSEEERGGGLHR